MNELENLKDVRDKLFYSTFVVHVPNKAFHTDYELENFGILDHGSQDLNMSYLNDTRMVHATIVQIAEWLDDDIEVALYDTKDATTMFGIIDTHLNNWRIIVKVNPNAMLPPFEDIEKLDKLAERLFPWAKVAEEVIDLDIFHDLMFLGSALDMRIVNKAMAHIGRYEGYAPKLFDHTLRRWERQA